MSTKTLPGFSLVRYSYGGLFAIFIGIFIEIDINLHLCDFNILIINAHANDMQCLFEHLCQCTILNINCDGCMSTI